MMLNVDEPFDTMKSTDVASVALMVTLRVAGEKLIPFLLGMMVYVPLGSAEKL